MPFTPRTWADGAAGGTAIDAANLNRMETGIDLAVQLGEDAAPLASPALTGNPTAPTQAAGNNSTRLATTAFVTAAVAAGGGGGGGGGTLPTYVGSSITANGGTSFTLALPGSAVAGDTAIIFVSGGNVILHPTGAEGIRSEHAYSGLSAGVFRRVLSSGDIAAGSITINTGAAFYTVASLVVYSGAVFVTIIDTEHHPDTYVTMIQNKAWSSSKKMATTEELLIVQTTRANVASTSSQGTLLQNSQGTCSMSVYRYPVPAAGNAPVTVNMPGAGFEYYFWRLAVTA